MVTLLYAREQVETADGSLVHLAFTSRAAGNLGLHVGEDLGATVDRRARLEEQLLGQGSGEGFTYLNQVHGVAVYDADGPPAPRRHSYGMSRQQASDLLALAPEADAASTSRARPLAVMVADCIPLIFVGEHRLTGAPLLGVAHAGRRGLLEGVIQAEVADLLERGAERLRAWIGPSICGSCYEVPLEMQDQSAQQISALASSTRWGTPGLDLPAGARAILADIPEVVAVSTECAHCTFETESLFSHRAVARGREAGRIAGLVWVDRRGK